MSAPDPSDGKQWGVLLEYLNPDTEAQFLKNFSACSFKYDVANHVIMISLGCAFSFIMTMINGATLGVNLFLVCISVTALRLYFILKRKDIYVKNRTVILMFSQTMHALLATLSSSYMPMPDYTRLSFVVMYLMRTPIMILNMVGIGLSVPIKAHVFSSLFACLASSVWILPFCSRCQNVDHAYPITVSETFFPDLSQTITEWLHRSTVIGALVDATNGGTPRPAPTPITTCWVPMLFLHLTFGYFFPCAVMYCAEAYQRAQFVCRRRFQSESDIGSPVSSSESTTAPTSTELDAGSTSAAGDFDGGSLRGSNWMYVWHDFRSTLAMGLWIAFMMVQVVWIFLRGIGEAMELRNAATDGGVPGFCPNMIFASVDILST
ncbi:hypothetical protein BSKO_13598 [Bryopsis sp. KO-2023]|nr:hypothetical protein BSKO_13598 [Bryopsis sp. KO-2023]